VRELENVVENAAILSREEVIEEGDIELTASELSVSAPSLPEPEPGFSIEEYLSGLRSKIIDNAIEQSGGNLSKAARQLGISPQAVHKYLNRGKKSKDK
jgi:DNA-binding NtrC family response regulator